MLFVAIKHNEQDKNHLFLSEMLVLDVIADCSFNQHNQHPSFEDALEETVGSKSYTAVVLPEQIPASTW